MIVAILLATAPVIDIGCERLTTREQQQGCAWAAQQLVCWKSADDPIRDDDPALPLFWDRDGGESIDNAAVDLAIERTNSCDPKDRR